MEENIQSGIYSNYSHSYIGDYDFRSDVLDNYGLSGNGNFQRTPKNPKYIENQDVYAKGNFDARDLPAIYEKKYNNGCNDIVANRESNQSYRSNGYYGDSMNPYNSRDPMIEYRGNIKHGADGSKFLPYGPFDYSQQGPQCPRRFDKPDPRSLFPSEEKLRSQLYKTDAPVFDFSKNCVDGADMSLLLYSFSFPIIYYIIAYALICLIILILLLILVGYTVSKVFEFFTSENKPATNI